MLRPIDQARARAELERRRDAGCHVDDRLLREVQRPGALYLKTLGTEEDFLSLVWQSTEETRPLTPEGAPLTLRDCVARLPADNGSFLRLRDAGYPWFDRCVALDQGFDYGKFGWVGLVPMNDHERRESPSGSYYVFDGVHKTIVLAKKLVRQEVLYEPVEALLLTPRR